MSVAAVERLARSGRLYPAVILHGGSPPERRETAVGLGRALLCAAAPDERPCGDCRHCRRVAWPGEAHFHPDFLVLERDLKTVTSVAATKRFLDSAQMSPFEARGQVFVIADADSLSPGAADALLKNLEEPHDTAPRHFLLLAPSQFDLSPTLRSRSLPVYLGRAEELDEGAVGELAGRLEGALEAYRRGGGGIELLAAAAILEAAGEWRDPRAAEPWARAAAAALACSRRLPDSDGRRQALLGLAADLLAAPELRLRAIQPRRILEGLLFRHLAAAS